MNTAPQLDNAINTTSEISFSIPKKLKFDSANDSRPYIDNEVEVTDFESVSSIKVPQMASPYLKPLTGRFQLLQMWEGRVTEILDDTFSAIILDKTNPNLPDELVTLDIEEVTPNELPLLKLGSIFYWSISYADYPGRGRRKESKIRFRRLPTWSQKEINRAIKSGEKLASYFQRD